MAELTTEQKKAIALARARLRLQAPPPPAARKGIEGDLRPGIAGVADAAMVGSDPLDRFLYGLQDIPIGAAQLVANALPDSANVAMGGKTADQINEELRQREFEYQAARTPQNAPAYIERYMAGDAPLPDRQSFDAARFGGNLVAALPFGAMGGNSMLGAAGVGTAVGLTTPQYSGDFSWDQVGQNVAVNTAGGLAGNLLGRGIAAGIRPQLNNDVRTLMASGVTPTPGQMLGGVANTLEQKATSIPVVGDAISGARQSVNREFNRAVYSDVLAPIGGSVPQATGREAIDNIATQISDAYENILPSLTLAPDQQLMADIAGLSQYTQRMTVDGAAQFWRDVGTFVVTPLRNGPMNGRAFKDLESALGRHSSTLRASADAYQRIHGEALGELQDILRDALARSNQGVMVKVNGQWIDAAQRLSDINASFANLVRLEKAAGAAGAVDGVFTPAQFLSAVRQTDTSRRRSAFARGNATMQPLAEAGYNTLRQSVPDSGTAGRMLPFVAGIGAATNPALAGGAAVAGSIPYTDMGRRLTALLLSQRPAVADPLRELTLRSLPGFTAAGALLPSQATQ